MQAPGRSYAPSAASVTTWIKYAVSSIRKNLTLNLVTGAVVLLLVAAVSIDLLLGRELRREFDSNLLAKARLLSGLVERDRNSIEFEPASRFMPEFESRQPLEYYELRLQQGALIDMSPSFGDTDRAIMTLRGLSREPRFRDVRLPDGRSGRQVSFLFEPRLDEDFEAGEDEPEEDDPAEASEVEEGGDADEVIFHLSEAEATGNPQVAITLARGTEELNQLIWMARTILGAAFILLIAGVALLAWITVRRGLGPLTRLSREVRKLDADRLFMRVSGDQEVEELKPITRQLNDLLDRLDQAFQREKRFSGDVAHELKTPISELRTMSEVGREWSDEREMVEGFFGDLVDLADDMERTVTNLLTLAHLDAGNRVVSFESVNLSELVDAVWKRLENDAQHRRITMDNKIPGEINVKTDRDKLTLILVNLISNAVSYAAEGSTITVDTMEVGDSVRLSITNIATDLTEQDLEVMLERFWRKDQSRTGGRHAGLGLSLVKELATVLNLRIRSLLDSGSHFTLTLSGLARA